MVKCTVGKIGKRMVMILKVKRLYVFVLIIGFFLLTGCVSKNEYDETTKNLSQSNEKVSKLEDELKKTSKELSDSLEKITKIESELDELKNGAQMGIIEIRKQYAANDYDKVIELSNILNSKFAGTPEDQEAQAMVNEIQHIRDEEARKVKEEEERRLAEERKSAQDKARSIMRISNSYPSKPNSAGGVDLYISWKNNSDKVIKYVDFSVEPYNAVNDKVRSEIGRNSLYKGRETGPFKKGEGSKGNTYWENAWYNNTIKTVQIIGVDIEYMDGTKVTLIGDDLKYIQY
jgi:outer membrane murein-binding lipoprotein Lpp